MGEGGELYMTRGGGQASGGRNIARCDSFSGEGEEGDLRRLAGRRRRRRKVPVSFRGVLGAARDSLRDHLGCTMPSGNLLKLKGVWNKRGREKM